MMSTRAVIFAVFCLIVLTSASAATSNAADLKAAAAAAGLRADPAPAPTASLQDAGDDAAAAGDEAAPDAAPAVKKGFVAIYYGLLITFVILFMISLFLNYFEYGTGGDYYFYAYAYSVLVIIIASGLSDYFTPSILTALLSMAIMLTIFLSGLGAMMGIASPDRFEGDKSNMGRTRLEAGM